MTDYALDYSAGWPQPAAVKAAGYKGVLRYIGFDPAFRPKCIGQAEYDAMIGAGLGVGLVYENQAGDALEGRAAGATAATRARHWAVVIGFPRTRPIYMACDTDIVTAAQFAAVLEYLRGAGTVLGTGLVGVYGEVDVIERAAAAGVAAWFWQTKAWSRGIESTHDHLLQLIGTVVVGGVGCDRNEIRRPDWGQAGARLEDDMPLTADDKADIAAAVWAYRMPDGTGDKTERPAEVYLTAASNRALTAIRQTAGLGDDEARILAALSGSEARLVSALLAEGSELESKILAAVAGAPQAPGGGSDPAAVVAALRDALARGTAGPA